MKLFWMLLHIVILNYSSFNLFLFFVYFLLYFLIKSNFIINILQIGDKNVERVLSWKFITLDKNSDGYLDRTEYKELRRLAKKAVKPKKCARTFARTCDLNRDLKLSRQEWGACLANDFTRKFKCDIYAFHIIKKKILEDFFSIRSFRFHLHDSTIFFPFIEIKWSLMKKIYLQLI